MVTLRADPWNPDFGMGFQAEDEESPVPLADPFVETEEWEAGIAPPPLSSTPVWFVDGVRRVELRLLVDDDGRRISGLFGSYAVGAVRCDGSATFDEHRVGRALVLGGGAQHGRVDLPIGPATLGFEGVSEAGTDPNAPLERLQALMRGEEGSLAAHVVGAGAPLVLADGPLRLKESSPSPVVGVVKRSVRRYLESEQERLLGRLAKGERTPLFALVDQEGSVSGFSWYSRIARMPSPWHDRAGLVRCEVRTAVGLEGANRLADTVTGLLPGFAGRPADPRTPQNLAPVAGLETWLRHRMGDRAMIRRALVAWLARLEG